MVFDLFLIVSCVAGLVTGAWKGFAWQLAGILSVVLGFVGGQPLAAIVIGQFEEPTTFDRFLAFAISYGLISVGCYLCALALRRKLEKEDLKRLDRHLGAFIGTVHGLVLCSVVTMFVLVLVPSSRDPVLNRPTGQVLALTLDGLHGLFPDGLHEILHPYLHVAEESATPSAPVESAPDGVPIAPAIEPLPSTDHGGH